MNYLIYIVFGNEKGRYKSELVYSLLSLDRMTTDRSRENIAILIYCDGEIELPDRLNHLPVSFNYLKKEDIISWINKGNGHSLILKAYVMLDFLQKYDSGGILVDTDTFFIRDPESLFETIKSDRLLMHLKEYPLKNRPKIHSFFQKSEFRRLNGDRYTISPSFYMWNSGVVGIHSDYVRLLPEIIFLIEQISFDKEWPLEERLLIEQTAYSYYLQVQETELLPAEEYIVHYWFFKEFRFLLGKYFDFFLEEDQEILEQILADKRLEESDFSELKYDNLPTLMFRFMSAYDMLRGYHFECLPKDTLVGSALRSIC